MTLLEQAAWRKQLQIERRVLKRLSGHQLVGSVKLAVIDVRLETVDGMIREITNELTEVHVASGQKVPYLHELIGGTKDV